ncbi:hypothetical protein H5410_002322 [Solanum commersonii]|uniref:Uncharacterized protein n=1 Tax=Solanum commersonii TaxID=4109 RepID=A0A9J6B1F1_SOLCO|nr:hypothetical protein H5410_002322 [Solanum commersonii]
MVVLIKHTNIYIGQHRGSIIPYKNSRHEGTFRTIILVYEEVIKLTLLITYLIILSFMFIVLIPPPLCTILGTKIQATLFNKHIETWKDSLKLNKSYYFVHKEVELAFTDNTIIKATDIEVSTHRFSVGFVSLDHVDKLPNGAILANYPPK